MNNDTLGRAWAKKIRERLQEIGGDLGELGEVGGGKIYKIKNRMFVLILIKND